MSAQINPATFAAGLTGGSNGGSTAGSISGSTSVSDTGSAAAAAGTVGAINGAINEAMAELNGLESASTRTHVSAFERVHQALTDALAAIDGV